MTPRNRLRDLVDDVWCLTCQHTHIPDIPTVTFRCHAPLPEGHGTVPAGTSGCGFGAWSWETAEDHATAYPEHVVYVVHHTTVPLGPPPPPLNGEPYDLPDGWDLIVVGHDTATGTPAVLAGWHAGAFVQYAPTEDVVAMLGQTIDALQETPRG